MLALEEMKKKNYKKALTYISAARLWPESLGVGKPYDSDIDERLEDWLSYENYMKLGNKVAAEKMLNKIVSFTTRINQGGNLNPSANNLISAWALQKTGKREDGERLLRQSLEKYPDNPVAKWAMNAYKGSYTKLSDHILINENYRVLENWILFNQEG
jgi:tetratricopeptide (TPR) repeat protein